MAPTTTLSVLNMGFLTILEETNGYLGGYLVTNVWGRPLEFRLSTAVQPNRVQQILYAGTLQPYICADLIGKTLVEKTSVPVQLVVTDREAVLELRQSLEIPVAWLAPPDDAATARSRGAGSEVRPGGPSQRPILCHPRFSSDIPLIREHLKILLERAGRY